MHSIRFRNCMPKLGGQPIILQENRSAGHRYHHIPIYRIEEILVADAAIQSACGERVARCVRAG